MSALDRTKRELAALKARNEQDARKLLDVGLRLWCNDRGATILQVFDVKTRQWAAPPEDFDADIWIANWCKPSYQIPYEPMPSFYELVMRA